MEYENLGRTQFKLRHRNPQNVAHYIQQAVAALAAVELSLETERLVQPLAPMAREIFPLPAAVLRGSNL